MTVALPGFEHDALFYRDDAEFTCRVGGFVRAGVAGGEVVAVALPRPRLDQLRDALGGDATTVTWLDMAEIGANPARIIDVWTTTLRASLAAGRPLRGVGEPAYVGRRPAELVECTLHERLLGRAFGDGPAWRLVCPYDEQHLPPEVIAGARRTHAGPGTDAEHRAAFAAPLPPPSGAVLRGEFSAVDVPAVRRTVRHWAASLHLPADGVEALELASAELAANSVRHGGGSGSVAMWTEDGAAVLEFTDPGTIDEPLTGRLRPAAEDDGGHGLYLVNQLCDLVQLRSSPTGTTVRVLTWL
ncbi:anti-sigma factor RsbA family regulatory protein [Petropleomorpha daqingensis]|uniref:Anti-sigma regulatory factor (Ser/Thr protein kinase) n=1 Tax=Petropleomorpha daqingensis TaxID=2026353 RepID=A0A853CRX7_9ACTN|nr:anti-sigma regulatory factor (Ser/Thr protein kinase) [Petropleomorpha daqingensis]